MTKNYFVTWASNIQAESPEEAAVKARAEMNDPDNWQFNSSVEETGDEIPTDEQCKFCEGMCGNESPCIADDLCQDYKRRFNLV